MVYLESDAVYGLAVAFLVKHFLRRLQVPQPPRVVVHASAEKPPRWMVCAPRHPFIVTLEVGHREVGLHVPQLDAAVLK